MTIEKLRNFEPLFGSWYIENMVAQGRSSVIYRVSRTENLDTQYLGLKTIRFPRSEQDFNRVMASGKYSSPEEYLSMLEQSLRSNMDKMMTLRGNKNIVRFDNYQIVRELNCFHVIILMELLTPLSEYLSPEKINSAEIAKMGADICRALAGFRQAGIMHREIKPENIFVDEDGSYKLGDFGISRIGSAPDESQDISTYLAPEVLRRETNDYCSDVYSLGILMYKFINNNRMPFLPPFPAPISIADRQRAFERRMGGELLPKPANADLMLSKIIFKSASYRAEDRYADPRLLEGDLQRYLSQQTTCIAGDDLTQAIPPVGEYRAANEGDVHFDSYVPKADEADRAKNEFAEAFRDDDSEEDDAAKNKRTYILLAVLAVVLVVVFVFVFKAVKGKDDETTVTTVPETSITTVTTTAPTTAPTTQAPTTTEPTIEETTTKEETTTEVTTEETTTEKPTEPTTTQKQTEPETTEPQVEMGPLYVVSRNRDGDKTADGKTYSSVKGASAVKTVRKSLLQKVIVNVKDLGANPKQGGDAYICQTSAGSVILKEKISFECIYDESDPDAGLALEIDAKNNEIYLEDEVNTFVVFEENAIETDNKVNLPFQIKL